MTHLATECVGARYYEEVTNALACEEIPPRCDGSLCQLQTACHMPTQAEPLHTRPFAEHSGTTGLASHIPSIISPTRRVGGKYTLKEIKVKIKSLIVICTVHQEVTPHNDILTRLVLLSHNAFNIISSIMALRNVLIGSYILSRNSS